MKIKELKDLVASRELEMPEEGTGPEKDGVHSIIKKDYIKILEDDDETKKYMQLTGEIYISMITKEDFLKYKRELKKAMLKIGLSACKIETIIMNYSYFEEKYTKK